jgi:hypothetical protein
MRFAPLVAFLIFAFEQLPAWNLPAPRVRKELGRTLLPKDAEPA